MLSSGSGKGRLTKNSEQQAVPKFRGLVLSSGEKSLSAHARVANKHLQGGAEVRMVDLTADAGKGLGLFEDIEQHGFTAPKPFADRLRNTTRKFYGVAIAPFIQYLAEELKLHGGENIKQKVAATLTAILKDLSIPDSDGESPRVAARFAVIAVAGELATEAGITTWAAGEALQAARICFVSWHSQRPAGGAFDANEGVNLIRRCIQEHGATRFERKDAEGNIAKVSNRLGVCFPKENSYCFFAEQFKEVCEKGGQDYRVVAAKLRDLQLLNIEVEGKNQRRKTYSGRQIWMYDIKNEILDGATTFTD
jgi:uncharacterized protein (DUF927 family)